MKMRTRFLYGWICPIALTLMTLTTTAQEQPAVVKKEKWGASKKADKMSDKLGRQLGLTREQNKQIFSINEEDRKSVV